MTSKFYLILALLAVACGGPSIDEPAPAFAFGSDWQAPHGANLSAGCYEVCAFDPDTLRIRTEGSASPGEACALVRAGEWAELWVTPEAERPYYNGLSIHFASCGGGK